MLDKIRSSHDSPDEIAALRQHLAITLKFHHKEILQKIPLEFAVRAMAEAWDASHPIGLSQHCSGTSTAIIPTKDIEKSIRESKYYEDS